MITKALLSAIIKNEIILEEDNNKIQLVLFNVLRILNSHFKIVVVTFRSYKSFK